MNPAEDGPDVEAASDEYAERFAGSVGQWFLQVQETVTLEMLSPYAGADVLDVGGGHGQTAAPLVREGYGVTVLGSSETCKRQIRGLVNSGQCDFEVGDILNLPFPDRAFDVVLSYRMMAHVKDWRRYLSELARVARHAVIVDYPDLKSFNYIEPVLFKLKKKIEGDTRPYKCFKMQELLARLSREGLTYSDSYRQFFWPMALHRGLAIESLSRTVEGISRKLGVTQRWGSPVILKVTRGNTGSS